MVQPVFRWSGEPVAFIEDWQLFDNKGLYLGWRAGGITPAPRP